MYEKEQTRVFRTTLKQVINNLSTIKDCNISDLENTIDDKFAGYNYEGEDEIIGFNTWGDISNDGDYKLLVKVNHEDAYELTLHATIFEGKATITNVL